MDDELADLVSSVTFGTPRDLTVDEVLEVQNEMAKELKNIENYANQLQAECKASKEKLSRLEKERATMRKDVTKLKEDNAAILKKLRKMETEIKEAQYKISRTNQISNITQKECLRQHEDELHAYKNITGIRWNFNVPDNKIEGIIANPRNNFVKAFLLEKSMPTKKIREILWGIIRDAASEIWHEVGDNKENEMT